MSKRFTHFASFASFVNQYSLDFNGSNQWLELGNPASLDTDQHLTISAWIKGDTFVGAKWIFGNEHAATFLSQAELVAQANGRLTWYQRHTDGSLLQQDSAVGALTTGSWFHVMGVRNNTAKTVELFINNVQSGGTGSYAGLTVRDYLDCGNKTWGRPGSVSSNYWDGKIDEGLMFNIALSAAQRNEIYNGGVVRNPLTVSFSGNLIGGWRMGDGSTYPTIIDLGSGGNNGTMQNMSAANIVTDVP